MTQKNFSLLKQWTQARIGLDRTGSALNTSEVLKFRFDCAKARDAVKRDWDCRSFEMQLTEAGEQVLAVSSQVKTKEEFLTRPDLGRKLSDQSREQLSTFHLKNSRGDFDITWILSDGLSTSAIEKQFLPFWSAWKPTLKNLGIKSSPLVLCPLGRVGISDEIGEIFHSKLSIILIGERPGLSSVDSMGIYLTYAPRIGNQDSMRNCISNIRPPEGLSYSQASLKLSFLIQESLRLRLSGVLLKEQALALQEDSKNLIG